MRGRDVAWIVAGTWAGGAVAAFLVFTIGGSDLEFWPWAVFVPTWWPVLLLTFEGHTLETTGTILAGAVAGAAMLAHVRRSRRPAAR